jgi:hypothetical protein
VQRLQPDPAARHRGRARAGLTPERNRVGHPVEFGHGMRGSAGKRGRHPGPLAAPGSPRRAADSRRDQDEAAA